jgi:hypothetical protein
MRRSGLGAAVAVIFLLARRSGEAMPVCRPLPDRVDPVYGNFTPISWPEGSLNWVNNAMGASLDGVWANTDFDMWFVGVSAAGMEPLAVHFDGFSLQPSRLPGTGWPKSVWGSASNDVWVVGTQGLIEHWDGTQWLTVPSGTDRTLYALSGTASDDVWAAGSQVMLHWDGSSWTNSLGFIPDREDHYETATVAAISSSDVLAASSDGCQRWDGASWQRTNCRVSGGRGIFATSSDDIWVVGWIFPTCCDEDTSYRAHWDGSSWTSTQVRSRHFGSIAGTGPADIWIDGTFHYDGTTWTEMNCGPEFNAMSLSNNGAFVGVNGWGIEHFSGNDGWPFLARTFVGLRSLGGRDPSSIWAVGTNGAVLRYDGSGWSGRNFQLPPPTDFGLFSAFGSSPTDIWGISYANGLLRHFDGTGWAIVDGPNVSFQAGFARTPNNAIAVERCFRCFTRPWHWDGTSWSQITLPIFGDDSIEAFWGTAFDDVWAVGAHWNDPLGPPTGVIYHWAGDSWQRVYTSAQGRVSHVGGSARDDAWFIINQANQRATVLHWDGRNFTELDSFDGFPLSIASSGPTDAWLGLDGGGRRYDGVRWNIEPLGAQLGMPGAGWFAIYGSGIFQGR